MMACSDAASVSGGESRQRCIGSGCVSAEFTKAPEADAGVERMLRGVAGMLLGLDPLRRYRLLRRGRPGALLGRADGLDTS